MCVHHWRIAPPDNSESDAVCLKCGEQRRFSNEPPTGRPSGNGWRTSLTAPGAAPAP
jgi:hypothetical protein